MARQYGIHYKYCACCAYWIGKRMCKRSSWKNQQREAESTCTWFELWPVMK